MAITCPVDAPPRPDPEPFPGTGRYALPGLDGRPLVFWVREAGRQFLEFCEDERSISWEMKVARRSFAELGAHRIG